MSSQLISSLRDYVRRSFTESTLASPIVRPVAGMLRGRRAAAEALDGNFVPYHGLSRRGITLLIDTTNKCNLRCVMCHFALPETRLEKVIQWSDEHIEMLERDILPHVRRAILSAGTEPLMWKGFPRLLEAVRRSGVPESEMITNGTLLTDELAELIVAAGITRVQISVDGATKEIFESIRVGANFEEVLASIDRLNDAKRRLGSEVPHLQLNATLSARNIDELDDILRLAKRHGVRYIDMRHAVVLPGLDMEKDSLVHEKERSNAAMQRAGELAHELGLEVVCIPEAFSLSVPEPVPEPDSYTIPAAEPEPSGDYPHLDQLPAKPACDYPWRQFHVRPDRSVVPCCFWYTDEPLGNLDDDSFEDIWHGEGYRRLRWQMLTGNLGPNCAACPAVVGMGSIDDDSRFRALEKPDEVPASGS